MRLDDKVTAAVTGAGSGIGRALALDLARRGCALALCDVDAERLEATAEMVASAGAVATVAVVDVAARDSVRAWAEAAMHDHGSVQLVVNNAGVALGSTVECTSYEDAEWLMGIDFWGVVHGTKAFLPHMLAADEGCIVNLSSVFGLIGVPTQSMYNAAKFAVRGFTESLSIELAARRSSVRALLVHPGGIRTDIARRARLDEQVAAMVGGDADRAQRLFEARGAHQRGRCRPPGAACRRARPAPGPGRSRRLAHRPPVAPAGRAAPVGDGRRAPARPLLKGPRRSAALSEG